MQIRRLTEADATAYLALRREMLLQSPWAFSSSPEDDRHLQNPEGLRSALAGPGVVIVGVFDGPTLVGAAGLFRDPHRKMSHRARIWGVYLAPAARGTGLAALLVTAAIEVARSWAGVSSIGLSVSERSVAAVRLYERLGFRRWGIEPAALIWEGVAYDEIHMVLDLAPAE